MAGPLGGAQRAQQGPSHSLSRYCDQHMLTQAQKIARGLRRYDPGSGGWLIPPVVSGCRGGEGGRGGGRGSHGSQCYKEAGGP